MSVELDSAVLFTPGRASYVESRSEGGYALHLTQASQNRAEVARDTYDGDFHTSAVFAGGYPGVAQNWPEERIPPIGRREADLMADPLVERLTLERVRPEEIARIVKRQGKSSHSIEDVLLSIEAGLLEPDDFNRDGDNHGIGLVTGYLHGIRFRDILSVGLAMDPKAIRRVRLTDTYGTPATEFSKAEPAPIALAKEFAAIALTKRVLHAVKPGDLEGLREAGERFVALATRGA